MSRRRKRGKSRKRLAYGVIAVVFILICIVTYSYLNPSNSPPSDQLQHKAAIVDHLSFKEETKNENFKNSSISILETAGFNVTYYPGGNVTVDFYRSLAWQDYGLIVLRVHSAIIGTGSELGLFTSELFNESKFDNEQAPYFWDVYYKRLVEAYFKKEDPIHYFAIAPGFVEKYANFQNTIVIMMGCDGLKYNTMAEAFRRKGAKVCIGWNGSVSAPHTDQATTCLLQHLAQGNTVEETVEETMREVGPEEGYNSTLEYYPSNAGSYTIQFTLGISRTDTIITSTVLVKEENKGTRLNRL